MPNHCVAVHGVVLQCGGVRWRIELDGMCGAYVVDRGKRSGVSHVEQ